MRTWKERMTQGLASAGRGRRSMARRPLRSRRRRLIVERLERRDQPAGFPFTIAGGQFLRDGVPVFLNAIGYQPLEPGQAITGEIREARVRDDLRRFATFRGGADPLLLRVYAQPTDQFPIRMPRGFYDGLRDLGIYVLRDIYFQDDYLAGDAIARGRVQVDKVINEVASIGALDRIFAWEIGNEFRANTAAEVTGLGIFLGAMRDHIKVRLAEPGREGFSDWVTWASWPPADPLRTDGTRFVPPDLDYYSINAYSYDPERIRDHQAGPVTGTPYAGYLAALKAQFPDKPLVVSETGLPDSPSAVGTDQERIPPLPPAYRRGHLTGEQVAAGWTDRYWDIRLSGVAAGVALFEWNDEWHKAGSPTIHDDHPEEYFGIVRFDTDPNEARSKLQLEAVRDLFTMQLPAATPLITGLSAQSTSLPSTGTTTIRALVSPSADIVAPVRFRWEASRGVIVGDSDTVQFHAADRALGTATVTVVAIDARGHATRASVAIAITPSGPSGLEALTLGTQRASGRVTNVDLDQFKVVAYIRTDQHYVQPYTDVKSIWVGPDGYWWTPVTNGFNGRLVAWVVPKAYDPPQTMPLGSSPPGVIATATLDSSNDSDNDLLPDNWERMAFPDLSEDRYGDPDNDLANNLEEFLTGTGHSPGTADNDRDNGGAGDGLPDTWERRFFGMSSSYNADDDPDGDGLSNQEELAGGIHPGRTAVDRDRDGLPDLWESRSFGHLTQGPGGDPDGDGRTNLDEYELALPPLSTGDIAGRTADGQWWVAENSGTRSFTNRDYGSWYEPAGWRDVTAADFSGDGRTDVVGRTASGDWWLAQNTGTHGFTNRLYGNWYEPAGWRDVTAADFSGDGRTDIAGRTAAGQWWVAENTGAGGFANRLYGAWHEPANWRDVRAGDFNGDGRTDLAGRTATGDWWVAENTGAGGFANRLYGYWHEPANWRDVRVGDFSGDGRTDIAGRTATGDWWVAENTGARSFTNRLYGNWYEPANWRDVTAADFSGDGRIDLAGRTATGDWWVAENTGAGGFANRLYGGWYEPANWRDVRLGDFSGDGRPDLAGRTATGDWWVAENTGTRGFTNRLYGGWYEPAGWRDVRAGTFSSSSAAGPGMAAGAPAAVSTAGAVATAEAPDLGRTWAPSGADAALVDVALGSVSIADLVRPGRKRARGAMIRS